MFWPMALSIEIGRPTRNSAVCADAGGAPIKHRRGSTVPRRPTAPDTSGMMDPPTLGFIYRISISLLGRPGDRCTARFGCDGFFYNNAAAPASRLTLAIAPRPTKTASLVDQKRRPRTEQDIAVAHPATDIDELAASVIAYQPTSRSGDGRQLTIRPVRGRRGRMCPSAQSMMWGGASPSSLACVENERRRSCSVQ